MERRKQVKREPNRFVFDGYGRDICHKKGGAAPFCGKAHHILGNVEAVVRTRQTRGEVVGIIALAAADVEHAVAVGGVCLRTAGDRPCQRFVVALVQKISARTRHFLIVALAVARLAREQQVGVALLGYVKAVAALAAQRAAFGVQRTGADRTTQQFSQHHHRSPTRYFGAHCGARAIHCRSSARRAACCPGEVPQCRAAPYRLSFCRHARSRPSGAFAAWRWTPVPIQ